MKFGFFYVWVGEGHSLALVGISLTYCFLWQRVSIIFQPSSSSLLTYGSIVRSWCQLRHCPSWLVLSLKFRKNPYTLLWLVHGSFRHVPSCFLLQTQVYRKPSASVLLTCHECLPALPLQLPLPRLLCVEGLLIINPSKLVPCPNTWCPWMQPNFTDQMKCAFQG